jgi:hypothetical protein
VWHCRHCGGDHVTVTGRAPGPCEASCADCKKVWAVCGAHPDAEGGPCMALPSRKADNGRCNSHGANAGRKPVTGAFSKSLRKVKWLKKAYEEQLADPELISLRNNIAVFRALASEELKSLGEKTPAQLWGEAIALYKEATTGSVEALKQLGKVLENGQGVEKKLEKFAEYTELERKHAEAESRRMARDEANLNVRDQAAFAAMLAASVLEEDTLAYATRLRIAERLARKMSERSNRTLDL